MEMEWKDEQFFRRIQLRMNGHHRCASKGSEGPVNRITGFTLFYLEHGREARLPVDMSAGPPLGQLMTLDRYTIKLQNQFARAFTLVAERQNSYVLLQKELRDVRRNN